MFQQTPQKRVLFPRTLALVMVGGFVVFTLMGAIGSFIFGSQPALAATNSTLNFQARLENAAGNIVPDGYYNVEFKIYNSSTVVGTPDAGACTRNGGTPEATCLWTERYYDSNGGTAGNDNRIQVRNGYVTANLGSQTAFPGTINWDQDLWVTMNIGGTTQTATPTWDGEMTPRLKLTGVPYAFKAGQLATAHTSNGFTSTLSLLQPTVGDQAFQLADQGAAGTYTICIQSSTACGFAAATGGSGYIQNSASGPQTANFYIQSAASGSVGAAVQAASSQSVDIFQVLSSTAATKYFSVNSSGNSIFTGEIVSNTFGIVRTSDLTGNTVALTLRSGNSSTGNSGNVIIDVGTATGTVGVINIGQATATTINIGKAGSTTNIGGSLAATGAITGSSTITGTTLNATTGINTGASAGTQRIDASGNLVNINNLTAAGNIQQTGAGATNYFAGALGVGTTNPQAAATAALTVGHDKWLSSVDSAGTGYVNLFKVNASNQIQVGAALNVDGGIILPTNGGQMTLVDLGIDSAASSGAKQSYTLRVGSTNALTVYGEADGSGNAQNVRVAVGSSIAPAYTLDVGGDINTSGDLRTGTTSRITAAGVLQNVTANANILTSGTLSSSVVTGSYTGITAVGTLTGLKSTGNVYIDTNAFGGSSSYDLGIGDTDTGFDSAGDGLLNAYANNANVFQFRQTAVNATVDLQTGGVTRLDTSGNLSNIGTISSGLLNGQTISSTANFTGTVAVATSVSVPLIQNTSANLTLQTNTSGNIVLNSAGTIELQDNTNVTGTLAASTSVTTPLLDTASAVALNIGTTNATVINLNKNVVVAAGQYISLVGGITNTRPASPTAGMLYFDTTTQQLLVYSNSKWQADRSTATKIVADGSTTQNPDSADYVVPAAATNAEVTINAAIAALPGTGGTVVLREGTYTVSDSINLPSNITLAGAGPATVLKVVNALASTTMGVIENADQTNGNSSMVIRDLRIDGNRSNQTAGTHHGIYLTKVGSGSGTTNNALPGATISSVWVENMYAAGMRVNIANSTIQKSYIHDNASYGIWLDVAVNNTIASNIIQDNLGNGIIFDGASTFNVISGNMIEANAARGVYINGSAAYNSIEGNTIIKNSDEGVSLNGVSNNTISDNKFHDNSASSSKSTIMLLGTGSGNAITGNTITDTAGSGYAINISVSTISTTYLSGNTYSGTGATAIQDLGTGTVFVGQLSSTGQVVNTATGALVSRLQSGSSADLFQAQDSSGNAVAKITSTGAVQGLSYDAAAAASLAIGGTNATSINIGKTGSNIQTTVTGTALFKPSSGNDSTTAFQVQDANALALFTGDSSGKKIQIGSATTDANAVLLILDAYNQTTDPTGTNGAMYYNSSMGLFRCYENSLWRNCGRSVQREFYYANEFMNSRGASSSTYQDDWYLSGTNSGSSSGIYSTNATPIAGRPGLVSMETGSTATGRTSMTSGESGANGIVLGNGNAWAIDVSLRVSTLSDATETFTMRAGFVHAYSSDGTDGCFFRYSHGVNGGDWQGVCRNASTESVCDTNIAVTAGTWYKLNVSVNSAGNSVAFSTDGTSRCTITTNIPTSNGVGFGVNMVKSVGTTNRTIVVDYLEVLGLLSGSR